MSNINKEREIIFQTITGSRLYGTHRPDSDTDMMGIFLPSTKDLLGLQNPASEWSFDKKVSTGDKNTALDTDEKYFSVKKFLELVAQGQSQPLEMIFAPRECWIIPTRPVKGAFSDIYKKREEFLSKESITPIIGFATAQAHRAVIKGENLNLIRDVIDYLLNEHPHKQLGEVVSGLYKYGVEIVQTEGNLAALQVAGRQFEFTQQLRVIVPRLKKMEERYGKRSEAAAENTYDYKSLMHAYRLIYQAKQILTEGKLVLPFDQDTVKFFLSIRNGEYKADYFDEIQNKLTEIRELKEKSTLPSSTNRDMVEDLCQNILYNHLTGGK